MDGTSENNQNGSSESASKALLHAAPDDHSRSEEIEILISKIRAQIRDREYGHDDSSPEDALADYQFGERLDFGLSGNGLQHCGPGWHVAEPGFTWTEAMHASLDFNLPASKDDLVIEFTAKGYINSKIRFQNVTVEINGMEICRIPISEKYTFTFLVPRTVLAPRRQFAIKFICENRASPSQFRRGADHRVLGIALHSLIIRRYKLQRPREEGNSEMLDFPTGKGQQSPP